MSRYEYFKSIIFTVFFLLLIWFTNNWGNIFKRVIFYKLTCCMTTPAGIPSVAAVTMAARWVLRTGLEITVINPVVIRMTVIHLRTAYLEIKWKIYIQWKSCLFFSCAFRYPKEGFEHSLGLISISTLNEKYIHSTWNVLPGQSYIVW